LNAAGLLNIDQEKLIETYLVEGDENYVIEPPCSFLEEDGKCRIQQAKPIECAEFPYTNKPERLFSLLGVMEFAQSCPIVFEVVQRLKDI
jgi:Fe-S-cluster containining protein